MKNYLYLGLIFVAGCCPLTTQNELPITDTVLKRKAFTVEYDSQHRQPRWVYQQINTNHTSSVAQREGCDFQEDPQLPYLFQSKKIDYKGSGFDRGHLCPAADAKSDSESMKETFYLSNISPQLPHFNRGYWKKLEQHIRNIAKNCGLIHVYTGPLYLPHQQADGKKYVTYQVIGENEVAVPTHYFKIIFYQKLGKPMVKSYLIPHRLIPLETPFSTFEIPLQHIEKKAGILFPRH